MVSYIQSSLNFIFTEIVRVLNIKFLLSQKYNSKCISYPKNSEI